MSRAGSSLLEERERRVEAYARARRRRRGQGDAGRLLREAVHALLRREIAATRPRRGRPPATIPAAPDLFADAT